MDNRRRRGRADRIRVAGGKRYEAQLVARKFRVGLAVVFSVIKRVGNVRSRVYDELRRLTSKRRHAARKKFGRVSDGRGWQAEISVL